MKAPAIFLGLILLFGIITPAISEPIDIPMSEKAKVKLSDKTLIVEDFEKSKSIEKRDGENKGFSKKISSRVVQIVSDANPSEKAKKLRALFDNEKLSVYVHLKPEFVDNPPKQIKVLLQEGNIVVTKLPLPLISKIAELDSVERISLIHREMPLGHDVSEGVPFSFADQLHIDGITGNGITVAVIDGGFFPSNSEISGNVVSQWFDPSCPGSNIMCGDPSGDSHGTAVAEIVVDMAPDVNLRLYAVTEPIAFNTAVQDAIDNNVDIITASLGYVFEGGDGTTGFYRDGTSTVAKKVNEAEAIGILVTIAVGNEGDEHWQGTYTSSPVTPSSIGLDLLGLYQSVMDFRPGESGADRACLPVSQSTLASYFASWNAWAATNQDYDLFFYSSDMSTILFASQLDQQLGIDPEPLEFFNIGGAGSGCLVLASFSSTQNHFFHIIAIGAEFNPADEVRSGSLRTPGDASGALSVGAINQATDTLEPFSSSGPTDDSRNKPEICGPDNTLSHQTTGTLNPFFGTSAATPHVAGAAALLMEKHPTISVDQLKNFLISIARFNASYSVNNLCGENSGPVDLSLVPGPPPPGTDVIAPIGTGLPGCESTSSCFIPFQHVITQGDQVTWYNDDAAAHTVTSGNPVDGPDGIFDSSLLLSGTTFSHTFNSIGTFPYFCQVHPWMIGEVVVNDITAPAAPTITSPTSGITTNDNTVTLTGDAESLSTVEIFDVDTSLGTTTATSPWTFTTPALSDGTHTFTATATDSSGNTSVRSVPVVVTIDSTPPTVFPPPNQAAIATSPSGAVVTYPAPTATDNVGVTVGPTCTPPSGSTFPIGITTVNCTAEDAVGNVGSASFQVTVFDVPSNVDVVIPFDTSVPGCEETNECYLPFSLSAIVGSQVVWFNADLAAHTVTSGNPVDGPDGIFDSGLFSSGTTFSHTFDTAGTFDYFCSVHPWMTGEIIVNPPTLCSPPGSGNWVITSSCTLSSSSIAPGSVIIQNNSVLTVPAGMSLDINFVNNFLRIESGSGLLIKVGGFVT